jgi:hypothetical protein
MCLQLFLQLQILDTVWFNKFHKKYMYTKIRDYYHHKKTCSDIVSYPWSKLETFSEPLPNDADYR